MTHEELDAIKEKANRGIPITADEVLRLVAEVRRMQTDTVELVHGRKELLRVLESGFSWPEIKQIITSMAEDKA